ncbi:MAG: transcription antitermination factor NusB [Acidimicrobiales bacterium]|nr:transcription antitermination factor NusB [Acidimicrobiales bacterium]
MSAPGDPRPAWGRRDARERALGLLYEAEMKGVDPREVLVALPVPADPYTADVVAGVGERRAELDAHLARLARGWTVERMPAVDRAILRLAAFELLGRPDVPTAVVIDEAVELAKRFSTDDSGRFVNGVLARLATEVRDGGEGGC